MPTRERHENEKARSVKDLRSTHTARPDTGLYEPSILREDEGYNPPLNR